MHRMGLSHEFGADCARRRRRALLRRHSGHFPFGHPSGLPHTRMANHGCCRMSTLPLIVSSPSLSSTLEERWYRAGYRACMMNSDARAKELRLSRSAEPRQQQRAAARVLCDGAGAEALASVFESRSLESGHLVNGSSGLPTDLVSVCLFPG